VEEADENGLLQAQIAPGAFWPAGEKRGAARLHFSAKKFETNRLLN